MTDTYDGENIDHTGRVGLYPATRGPMGTVQPGWAKPSSNRAMHWWRSDGRQLCASSARLCYSGPKVGADPSVAEACPKCFRALADAADLLGVKFPELVAMLRSADEIERLRAELDAAQLRSIEARNPGIDMDEVRRRRETDRG